MNSNRKHDALPGRLDAEIFDDFGEEDSIVDRLLAMPPPAHYGGGDKDWQNGIARQVEKVLAEKMRDRIEGAER